MDTFTAAQRSEVMRRVRSTDTKPELAVRRLVHRLGFRYSLRRRDLPGFPDLAFPSRRCVIFVHGCFWHGHSCRAGQNRPSSNQSYWLSKLARNEARDAVNRRALRKLGWRVLTIWECEVRNASRMQGRITRFLKSSGAS